MRKRSLVIAAALLVALLCAAAARAEPLFVLEGRGFGHGIGMSQYGAQGFAQRGWGYERILLHYYPGTRLGRAEPRDVRVLLAAGRKQLVVSSPRPFRVVDDGGRRATLPAGRLGLGPKLVVRVQGRPVRLRSPVRFEGGAAPIVLAGKPYRGAIVVRSRGGRMSAVNHVPLDRYLSGVVPYEMPNRWHPEALKAQAVVARSYALATLKARKLFDLFDDQRSQVYGGVRAETPETNRAVGATAGRVLRFGNAIATTFYHSTSGGRTAAIADVWPGAEPLPYLRGVADPHDAGSPHHTWGPIAVTRAQLAQKLKLPALKTATDVLVERNRSGRAARLRVRTPQGARVVDAGDFRRALELRSTWLQVGVLNLAQPRGRAVFGRPFELHGVARGLRSPVLQRHDGTAWRQVARVRPRADGAFVVAVKPQPGTAFRLAAQGLAGPQVRVRVAPQVRLVAAAGTVRGRVQPPLPRTRVEIQRRTAEGWRTVAAARVDGAGSFAPAAVLPDGDYRALVGPGGAFVSGASAPVRLRSE